MGCRWEVRWFVKLCVMSTLNLFSHKAWRREEQPTPVFTQIIPRTEEPGALWSIASQRVRHD